MDICPTPFPQALTVTAATALHGAVTINPDGTLTCAPEANYFGADTISYTITDNGTTNGVAAPLTASSTVAVIVTEVNDSPTAVADTVLVADGGMARIHVLANDGDPDLADGLSGNDDTLNVELVSPPTVGSVTLNADKSLTYAHPLGRALPTFFSYRVIDSDGAASEPVTVTINAASPLASGQVVFESDALRLGGTGGNDTIEITLVDGLVRITLNGVDVTSTLGPISPVDVVQVQASGGDGNDVISVQGLSLNTLLDGGSGDDTITGGDGLDVLYGGTGNDILRGGMGLDKMYGQLGNDVLIGGADRDTMSGQGGHDWLDGEGGNDLLYGNGGNDRIHGREGKNRLYGHQGNDVLVGGPQKDRVVGAEGFDIVIAGAGPDSVLGHSEEDLVIGGTTAYDADDEALATLAAAWIQAVPLADRILRIGTTGFGEGNKYRLVAGQTVLSDAAIDELAGNGQADWYFAEEADNVQQVAVDVITKLD